jgi:microsomal dipeptidase-like Zn-dependent dipeptidase
MPQLSETTTLQVLARARPPAIANHTDVLPSSNVGRYLSDEEIDLIGANGGEWGTLSPQ